MRPIVMCRNPKFSNLVMDCNLAAMAMRYPNDYVNEQYRDLKKNQLGLPQRRAFVGKRSRPRADEQKPLVDFAISEGIGDEEQIKKRSAQRNGVRKEPST